MWLTNTRIPILFFFLHRSMTTAKISRDNRITDRGKYEDIRVTEEYAHPPATMLIHITLTRRF
jgi:hypothetical protein